MQKWSLSLSAGLVIGAALAAPLVAADGPKAPKQRPAQHGSAHGARSSAPQPAVPGPDIGFRGCAYFEDAGFAGRRGDLRAGDSAEWIGAAWDNRISSVACASQCRLVGYADTNYGGARRNFSGAVADVGEGWNDRISALRVVCAADEAH